MSSAASPIPGSAASPIPGSAASPIPSSAASPIPGSAASPIWFGPDDAPLFGWYHAPAAPVRDRAVLLCPPVGYDQMLVHRTYRHLAERLAQAGFAALRFDHAGTGDSSGNDLDGDRVEPWIAGTLAALDELRRRSGQVRVALFGVRTGALLGTVAATRAGDIDELLLLGAVRTGKVFVKELRALAMTRISQPQPGAAIEEAAGFAFTAATVRSLSALDLGALEKRPARRALLLERDDFPGGDERLRQSLSASGMEVVARALPGYSAMMRDPAASEVPGALIDAALAFLEAGSGPAAPAAHLGSPAATGPSAASGASAATGASAASGAPAATDTPAAPRQPPRALVRSVAGAEPVAEETLRFGAAPQLAGVLTEPARKPATQERPAVLLLNVGANHRIGPSRLWVTLARTLAERGFTSLRLDLRGLGDSPAERADRENKLYDLRSIDDVQLAMAMLRERGFERFVLLGLCSGAYLAYHTAVLDESAAGIVLINLQTFHWSEGDSLEIVMRQGGRSTLAYRRAVLELDTWKRMLTGKVNLRLVLGALASRFLRKLRLKLRDLVHEDEVKKGFRKVLRRGGDALVVLGDEDGGVDALEAHVGSGARQLRNFANFKLEIIPGSDHTFTPRWSRDRLVQLLTDHLVTHFGGPREVL